MCVRVALHSSLRVALVLFVGLALLPVPCISILVSAMGQGQSQDHRSAPPRPGKPEGALPDLEDVQNESHVEREPPPACLEPPVKEPPPCRRTPPASP